MRRCTPLSTARAHEDASAVQNAKPFLSIAGRTRNIGSVDSTSLLSFNFVFRRPNAPSCYSYITGEVLPIIGSYSGG
jgi:hypothetical protein